MFIFILSYFLVGIIQTQNVNLVTLIILNITSIEMAILTGIIYFNEKIYWYTGISYEESAKATSEQRKNYALKHFIRFGIFALVFLLYSIIAYFVNLGFGWSIVIATFGIVGVAISTMPIKL